MKVERHNNGIATSKNDADFAFLLVGDPWVQQSVPNVSFKLTGDGVMNSTEDWCDDLDASSSEPWLCKDSRVVVIWAPRMLLIEDRAFSASPLSRRWSIGSSCELRAAE